MPLSGWQAFCARPLPWSIYGSAQTVRDIAAASLCGPFLLHGADDPGSFFSLPELPSASCSCALYGMCLVLAEPGCQASYRECLAGQWDALAGAAEAAGLPLHSLSSLNQLRCTNRQMGKQSEPIAKHKNLVQSGPAQMGGQTDASEYKCMCGWPLLAMRLKPSNARFLFLSNKVMRLSQIRAHCQ